jgi:Circularly permutated YpsA SLOG family
MLDRDAMANHQVQRIVSGGQTGADQAGLEAAEQLGVPTGGFMPKGFRTETGPRPDLAARYGLQETATADYPERTEQNVLLADGTVVIAGENSRGSRLTVQLCRKHGRPCLAPRPDLLVEEAAERLRAWLVEHAIGTLNVAGRQEA